MTTQLPPRERPETEVNGQQQHPDVLFEEARRRRRRRWMMGAVLSALIIAAVLTLNMAGGGGGGTGGRPYALPSNSASGAGSGHLPASRTFPGAPVTQGYYTGPGATCPLAPHSRYLPPWSGCISTMIADVSGNGRGDLVLAYSRLGHKSLGGLPPRTIGRPQAKPRYPALQAMLRVVTPDGRITTVPITYKTSPSKRAPAQMQRAAAAALISVAHVSSEPGKTIFLQTNQISSGSLALAYSLYQGRLVSSGVVLGYGGDAGSQAGFRCLAGSPPRLIQYAYGLIRGITSAGNTVHIYGVWKVTATRYEWNGPRLVRLTQNTTKRRLNPADTVGRGCVKGIG